MAEVEVLIDEYTAEAAQLSHVSCTQAAAGHTRGIFDAVGIARRGRQRAPKHPECLFMSTTVHAGARLWARIGCVDVLACAVNVRRVGLLLCRSSMF